jgi:hypothetical protein
MSVFRFYCCESLLYIVFTVLNLSCIQLLSFVYAVITLAGTYKVESNRRSWRRENPEYRGLKWYQKEYISNNIIEICEIKLRKHVLYTHIDMVYRNLNKILLLCNWYVLSRLPYACVILWSCCDDRPVCTSSYPAGCNYVLSILTQKPDCRYVCM